ncbi:hypothetical protein [Novosphingobium sp.]|uniref:hypothetical protein n=1 Tax=Novosphingobium sp. TaxID=1874826 RepID=UPI003B51EF3A
MPDPKASEITAPAIGPMAGFAILVALVPLIAGYIALGVMADRFLPVRINVSEYLFTGFLFSLYWGGIKQMAPTQFCPAMAGSLGGIGTAYLSFALPPVLGPAGSVIALFVIALSVYLLIRNKCTSLINNAFMLLLTVGTCKAFERNTDYIAGAFTIVLAAAYMQALMLIAGKVATLRAARAPIAVSAE